MALAKCVKSPQLLAVRGKYYLRFERAKSTGELGIRPEDGLA